MGSRVNVCSVITLDNPGKFTDRFTLEITFEAFQRLPHDLEWELVYVGSGESTDYDQILDSVLVGPTEEGKHKFNFTADAPNPEKIPVNDIVGVSVLLLKCRYNEQEFLNLGWFVSNEYPEEEVELKENPPSKPVVEKLKRTVQSEDIRVTSFPIKWDDQDVEEVPPQVEEEEEQVDEEDLMPLEDNEEGEDADDEDDEEDENNDGVVDLESMDTEVVADDAEAEGEMDGESREEKPQEEKYEEKAQDEQIPRVNQKPLTTIN
ncbi:unnamed protein product [Auanema sp. JU1783]|nr:unnamed protein product [Auanema sp. JU1783]